MPFKEGGEKRDRGIKHLYWKLAVWCFVSISFGFSDHLYKEHSSISMKSEDAMGDPPVVDVQTITTDQIKCVTYSNCQPKEIQGVEEYNLEATRVFAETINSILSSRKVSSGFIKNIYVSPEDGTLDYKGMANAATGEISAQYSRYYVIHEIAHIIFNHTGEHPSFRSNIFAEAYFIDRPHEAEIALAIINNPLRAKDENGQPILTSQEKYWLAEEFISKYSMTDGEEWASEEFFAMCLGNKNSDSFKAFLKVIGLGVFASNEFISFCQEYLNLDAKVNLNEFEHDASTFAINVNNGGPLTFNDRVIKLEEQMHNRFNTRIHQGNILSTKNVYSHVRFSWVTYTIWLSAYISMTSVYYKCTGKVYEII